MTKTFVIGVVAVLGVVLGLIGLPSNDVNTIKQVATEVVKQNLGNASSPSVVDGCQEINGVTKCYRSVKMATATTTVCSLRSPRQATSTLVSFTANFNVATTGASSVYIAKAVSDPTASTTALTKILAFAATQAFPVVIGEAGDLVGQYDGSVATTTKNTSLLTFAPGHLLNVSVQGSDSGGTDRLAGLQTSRGNCYGEWLLVP
jgi:hypothetical protein